MWCRSVQRQLVPYVDGRLRGRRHVAVAAHLESCQTCSAAADGLRELHALLDSQPEAVVPPEFESEVIRRIRGGEPESSTLQLGRWIIPLAAGACAVGVALYVGHGVRGPEEPSGESGAAAVARAPVPGGPTASPTGAMRGAGRGASAGHEAPEVERPAAQPEGSPPEDALAEASKKLPPDLFGALDLFVDFPVIWQLEKFEHYEAIWALSDHEAESTMRGG